MSASVCGQHVYCIRQKQESQVKLNIDIFLKINTLSIYMVENTSALVILPFFIQVTRVTLTAWVSHRYCQTQNYINYVHWVEKQF